MRNPRAGQSMIHVVKRPSTDRGRSAARLWSRRWRHPGTGSENVQHRCRSDTSLRPHLL